MTWKEFFIWSLSIIFKPKPKPPTPPITNEIQTLFNLHNAHRQTIGLHTLAFNVSLLSAANKHSNWMYQNNKLSHYENNQNPGDRIRAEGYVYISYGENIAFGYLTAAKVFEGWLNSSGHRANIENSGFRDIGLGMAGTYWTVVFGSQRGLTGKIHLPEGLKGNS